ncbi:MAG: 16S rRNA (guanine(527)-N(7))-methyltransferase RsmG [Planctomycetota bacterium]
MSEEPESLIDALALAEVELPGKQVDQLDAYRQLLWAWNGRMNLTRHTTFDKFVTRDLVDSLELAKLLERGERVLDVGSGGGVPGIILAIVRPDLRLSLCESVNKKAEALGEMVAELNLDVPVYPNRVDDLLEACTFDTLVARAVAPMKKMLRWLQPRWESFDRLLLIKGRSWVDERGEARHHGLLKELELRKSVEYFTPRTDALSVILSLRRTERAGDA